MTSPTRTALASPPSPTRPSHTAVRVIVVVVTALAAAAAHRWYGNRHQYFDLKIYRGAVRWWAQGQPLYNFSVPDPIQHHLGFTYPPFAALLMYPMAWLGLRSTIAAMWIVSLVALVFTTVWLLVPVADRHGWPRWFTVCLALPIISWLEPIRETVTFGQINLALAFLILADLLVLAPRGSRFTGVGIGLAAAIKLTPAIFILYLLLSRRYRAAAVAAGTAVGATLVAAAFRFHDSWQYWTSVLWDSGRVGNVELVPNQSLLGGLSRLADPHKAPAVIWALLALVALCFGMWRAARVARAGDEVTGLTLAGVTGTLISPVSWQHHLYWFVPALVVLLDVAATRRRAGWPYAAFGVLIWVTVTWSVIAWYDWYDWPKHIMHTPLGLVIDDWDVLLMLAILAVLPFRRWVAQPAGDTGGQTNSGV
ncbi:MAG TPA: glycosyltransferase 87 family protein, partial [Rugosimonospora sp.]|nr:glycosyltransferase 87 family protein [Rugosimonospora sp.]